MRVRPGHGRRQVTARFRWLVAVALSFCLVASMAVVSATPADAIEPADGAGRAVLVVGGLRRSGTPNTRDVAIRDLLQELGFSVEIVVDDDLDPSTGDGGDLVVVSSSVLPSMVGTTLAGSTTPVVLFEGHLAVGFGLTTSSSQQGETAARDTLTIVDETSELSGGLSGTVTVTTSDEPMSMVDPGGEAQVVAEAGGDPVVVGFDVGATLADGGIAPARRVLGFPSFRSPSVLTEDGRRLVEAILAWAVGAPDLVPNQAPTVAAGDDLDVRLPTNAVTLAGTVTDDGKPLGSSVVSTWTQVSGPSAAVLADPSAPTTDASGLVEGEYRFELSATDGELSASDEVLVRVRPEATPGRRVAFVAGNAGTPSRDQPIIDRLLAAGAELVQIRDVDARSTDYSDFDLIFLSGTSRLSRIGNHFAAIDIPLMTNEHWLLDDMAMASRPIAQYRTSVIEVIDPVNPLAGGLSGPITITRGRTPVGAGVAGPGADVVATIRGHDAYFHYDAGDEMAFGVSAPAMRLYFPGSYGTAYRGTDSYFALMDAALAEALGADPGPEPDPELEATPDVGVIDEDLILMPAADVGLLANDSGADPLTIIAFDATSTLGAAVDVQPDGSYSYDPTESGPLQDLATGEQAVDTFDYTVQDGSGATASTTVSVTVNGLDEPIDEPRIDRPMFSEGWHADPPEVIFDADGQSAVVQLVHYGPDGSPSGQAVPAGVTSTVSSGLFTVAQSADGRFDVSGSATIGADLASITVPGQDTPVQVWITSVRLQPDVELVGTDDIVFPPPNGADVTTFDPFTQAEFLARTTVDETAETRWIAVVLQGSAPATGTKLGGAQVMGQVIEPTGLPTLSREGFSLVTVELLAVNEIYSELEASIDLSAIEPVVGELATTTPLVGSRSAAAPGPDVRPLVDLPDPGPDSACAAQSSVSIGSVTFINENTINLVGTFDVSAQDQTLELKDAGVKATITRGLRGTLQLKGKASVKCTLFKFPTIDFPMPGPLAALGSVAIPSAVTADLTVESGDPFKTDFEVSCSASIEARVDLAYHLVNGLSGSFQEITPRVPPCTRKLDPTAYYPDGLGAPLSATTTFSIQFEQGLGIRAGGQVVKVAGEILGKPDAGVLTLVNFSTGPAFPLKAENMARVVREQKNETGLEANWLFKASLLDEPLKAVTKLIFGPNVAVANPFPGVNSTYPLATLISPPSGGGITLFRDDTLLGGADGTVLQDSEFVADIGAPSFLGLGMSDLQVFEVKSDGTFGAAETVFQTTVGPDQGSLILQMTPHLCRNTFDRERTYRVAAHLGQSPLLVPAYIGEFTLICVNDIELEFQPIGSDIQAQTGLPPTSETRLHRGHLSDTLLIKQIGHDGDDWELISTVGDPDGLVVYQPTGGTFASAGASSEVRLECGDDKESSGVAVLRARVDGGSLSESQALVHYNCSPAWFEVIPSIIDLWRGNLYFRSDGPQPSTWEATRNGDIPVPGAGQLPAEVELETLGMRDPRSFPQCGDDALLQEVRNVTFETPDRGTDSVLVVLPQRRRSSQGGDDDQGSCESEDGGPGNDDGGPSGPGGPGGPGPANGNGDPHLASFDGVRYDAQVLGEYLYATTEDGATQVVARHESSVEGELQLFGATSITAMAVVTESTVVELVAGIGGGVRVNGNRVTLPVRTTVDAGGGISLTRAGGSQLTIVAPGIYLETWTLDAGSSVPYIRFLLWGQDGTPLTGMMGSNDGEPSNDLMASDGTIITVAEARAHDTEFYAFTDSWRLSDPARSPFTIPSGQFDAPNEPRPDTEVLAPFRAQVLDQLGGLTSICSGDFSDGAYIVDQLAIELAIGTPVTSLDDFSCDYTLSGRVTTMVGDVPIGVHGAVVQVDAVGLAPCEAVALPTGSWSCTASPDLDEIGDGSTISLPLAVTVDVISPGGSAPVASTTASIEAKVGFGQIGEVADVDLTVDPDDLVVVELVGQLTDLGAPRFAPTSFDLTYTGPGGENLGSRARTIVPSTEEADGTYVAPFVIPAATAEVGVTWDRAEEGDADPSTTLSGFAPGINTFTFDAEFDPAVAEVSGTLLINGLGVDRVLLTVDATLGDGSVVTREIVGQSHPLTGEYFLLRNLPDDTVSAVATISLPGTDVTSRSAPLPTVDPGRNPLTIDVIVTPPVLAASGTAARNGEPVTGPFEVTVGADRSGGGSFTETVTVDPDATGAYGLDLLLPEDATAATVTAAVGPAPSDHPSITVPLVDGPNPVVFDFDVTHPVLQVAGTVTANGVPFTQPLTIRAQAGSVDELLFVDPIGDGSYAFDLDVPGGTTSGQLTAQVGFGPADHVVLPLSGLVDGPNPTAFDIGFGAVVLDLTGTLTQRGQPVSGSVTLDLQPEDATGGGLGQARASVLAGADGTYSARVALPVGTAAVDITTLIGGPSTIGRLYQRFDGLAPGANPAVFDHDHDPPVINLGGAFTADGSPIIGPATFEAQITYTDRRGFTATLGRQEDAFLSIADGTYALDFVLPETASAVDLTAQVGVDPLAYPSLTVDPVVPGDNPVVFSADLTAPSGVVLDALLSVDGVPFVEATRILYRAYDEQGLRVGETEALDVDPDATGRTGDVLTVADSVRRIEFAWEATPGPTYQSFDVSPGGNALAAYVADTVPVALDVTGTLTDGGAPFTDPTQIRVTGRRTPTGATLGTELIDVTPDGNGDYSFSAQAPFGSRFIDLRWLDAAVADDTQFPVDAGSNALVLDGTATTGPQRIEVSGALTAGGAPWPDPVEFILRHSGDGGPQTFPVTADPVTGSYSFGYDIPNFVTGVTLFVSGNSRFVAVGPSGTTATTYDIDFGGRLLDVAGTVVEAGAAPASVGLAIADASDPTDWNGGVTLTTDPTGQFDQVVRTFVDGPDVLVGFTTFAFEDDAVFDPDPVALSSSGLTTIADVVGDVTPPTIDLSGTLALDGTPVIDPVDVEITWFDDEPFIRSEWTSTVSITPNAAGVYTAQIPGPLRADRALVEADLATADPLQRTVEVAALAPGSNPVELSVTDSATTFLRVSGTLLDRGQPADGTYALLVEARDSGGQVVATTRVSVGPDPADGTYSVDAAIPETTAEALLTLDMTVFEYPVMETIPELVFARTVTSVTPGAVTETTFDAATTHVEISGVVRTADGQLRADEFFTYLVGGLGGDGFTGFSDGSYTVAGYASGPTVDFSTSFAAPTVTVTGLSPGTNTRTIELITDDPMLLRIGGSLAIDGAQPPVGTIASLTVIGSAPGVGEISYQEVEWDWTGPSGAGTTSLLVPPEVESVVLEAITTDGRTIVADLDLAGLTPPFDLVVDLDLSS